MVELKPVPIPVGPVSEADLQWLADNCVRPQTQLADDAGKLMSDLRDAATLN
jgi:hypothetical protein